MRAAPAALVLALILAGPTRAQERSSGVAAVTTCLPLWQAFREGKVQAAGKSSGGHHRARLTLRNRTGQPLAVDVNASWLRPSTGSVQPLGIGLVTAGSPVTEIDLPASGAAVDVETLSVCMKSSAASPDASHGFTLASDAAPGDIGHQLRAWKASPSRPQSEVQSLVWGHPPAPPRSAAAQGPRIVGLPAGVLDVAVHAGRVLAIDATGGLVAAAPDRAFAPIASAALALVPGDPTAMHVVLSLRPGSASRSQERTPCLARIDSTTVSPVLDLAAGDRVVWARAGAALIARGRDLVLVAPGARPRPVGRAGDAVTPCAEGALVVGRDEDAGRFTVVERVAGRLRVRSVGWVAAAVDPTAGVAVGPAGTFVAGNRGSLLRVNDQLHAVRVPLTAAATVHDVAMGRTEKTVRTVIALGDGALVLAEDAAFVVADGPAASVSAPPSGARLTRDAVSGEVWAFTGSELVRFAAGSWIPVRFLDRQ